MSAVAPTARRAPLPITRRWLSDGWRGQIGWTAGLSAVALLYLPLYPAMRTPELTTLLDSLPPALVRTIGYEDIASGAGYTQATFFGLIGFVLITIAAISWGARYTGGAEESGLLELTLSHSVGRTQYALESALAILARLLLLGVAAFVVVWALNGPGELDLDPMNLLAVTLAWVGLGLVSAAAAFGVGAASGRRAWAVGGGAAVAVVGYVLQAVANNSPDLDGLRLASPYEWAFGQAPLSHGFDVPGMLALAGVSAVFVAVGTLALSRRDILG